ncbi:MAG TPA: TIGR04013 family B12-binding domain/radical SAM domain-containing protein, partial [Candidatus Hodarchaeales archaeon]|nr:TIGR04013 family B12-binding domain/radical SAM domain-containing protein [Candidatus Hodarchaeales archaeon]
FLFDSFMSVDCEIVRTEMESILRSQTPEHRSRLVAVAGGAHPTAAPEHTLDMGFDIAARGEGEIIIERIVSVVLSGDSWLKIPGITFIDQGFVQQTPSPKRIELDQYSPYSSDPPIHPPIEIMRGCSFGCKFCQVPRILRVVRYRSIESIDKIVSYYCEYFSKRRSVDIRFIAPNSLEYGSIDHRKPNLDALWKLVKTVKNPARMAEYSVRMFLGSFPSEVRPEFVSHATVEVLKESDSNIVAVGAQSGSPKMLEKMHRGHTMEDIRNCVDYLLQGGLIPQLDFIIGLPEETVDEMWATVDMIKELTKKGCRIRLHGFLPLPGTPWGAAPPTSVPEVIRSELGLLLASGVVDGALSKQLMLASPVLSYR